MNASRFAVVAILAALACGRSQQATAATMRQDLSEMRKAIRDYRRDKGHPPPVLNEIVAAGYLRQIPNDPVTGAPDWRVVTEEPVRVDEFTRGVPPRSAAGIVDVHSAATGADANGKRWSEY